MKIKLIRKIKQRIRDISNVWSVAGIRNVYVMAILPHFGSKSTRDIRRERKQQAILHYLQTNYQNLILKYTQKEEIPPASNQAPIWVCWWQGENAMPPIVQSCFQSLCSHAGNHLVHLITQEMRLYMLASPSLKKFFKNRYLQWQPILIQITFLKQNGWDLF